MWRSRSGRRRRRIRHVAGVDDPRYLVQQLIAHQRELPPADQVPAVRAYFAQHADLPEWADIAALRRGQQFFNVFGVHIASALFCASLPMSYTAPEGAQVLTHTMALVSDTRRRLAQTGEMLLDVMGANDAADAAPFGSDTHSFHAPHGVRLFHAAVRYMLRHDPTFDAAGLGEPINQEDLLGTLTAFTVVVLDSLERFGIPVSDDDRDAYVHCGSRPGRSSASTRSTSSAAGPKPPRRCNGTRCVSCVT